MRQRFQDEIDGFREGLVEMASLTLAQVERAVTAWDETDVEAARAVMVGDELVDEKCAELDHQIFSIQVLESPVARDQRLLHVGLIAVVALERVGDLAVAIAEMVTMVPPEGADPNIQKLIRRMSARAVDTLATGVQSIARGNPDLGERAGNESRVVADMLDDLLGLVAQGPDDPEAREWSAAAVLVGRHIERVANNGRELGGRVRFLVDGEPFQRGGGPEQTEHERPGVPTEDD
ncbi:MAG: phosphate signaling complex PhoU family protein [Miltoncostaeaceae bacterium]